MDLIQNIQRNPCKETFEAFSVYMKTKLSLLIKSGKSKVEIKDVDFFNEVIQEQWIHAITPFMKDVKNMTIER